MDNMCQDLVMKGCLKNAGRLFLSVEACQALLARTGLMQIIIDDRSIEVDPFLLPETWNDIVVSL